MRAAAKKEKMGLVLQRKVKGLWKMSRQGMSETWDEDDEDLLTEATWFAYSERVAKPAIGQEDVPSWVAGRVNPVWFEGEGPSRPQPRPTDPLDREGDGWHTPHDSDYAQTIEVMRPNPI
jgi:hypothetical protein